MRHIYASSARHVLGDERQTHICICRSRTAATPSRKPRSKASVSPWRSTIAAFRTSTGAAVCPVVWTWASCRSPRAPPTVFSTTCPSRRADSRGPTRSSRGCGGTCWTTTALSRDAPVVFNLFYLTRRWSRRRRGAAGRPSRRARAVAVRAPTRFRRLGRRGAGTAGASRRAAGGPGPLRRRPTLRPECARSPPACTSRGFARRRRGGRAPGLRVPRLIARLTTRRLLHSA